MHNRELLLSQQKERNSAAKQKDLEDTMLRDTNQIQKEKFCMFCIICGSLKKSLKVTKSVTVSTRHQERYGVG